jgi:hypothetical protein
MTAVGRTLLDVDFFPTFLALLTFSHLDQSPFLSWFSLKLLTTGLIENRSILYRGRLPTVSSTTRHEAQPLPSGGGRQASWQRTGTWVRLVAQTSQGCVVKRILMCKRQLLIRSRAKNHEIPVSRRLIQALAHMLSITIRDYAPVAQSDRA